MKKLFISAILFLGMNCVDALPVGNIADPLLFQYGLFWDDECFDCYNPCYEPCGPCGFDWGNYSLRVGYYGDFVFDRKIKSNDPLIEERIDRFKIITNAGLVILNFWEIIDLYGVFGGTRIKLDTDQDAFGVPNSSRLFLETETEFSWSFGIKAVLWECDCTVLGIEGQYFSTNPNVQRITFENALSVYPDDTVEIKYHEWQVSLGLAHQFEHFIPYLALKWSQTRSNFNGTVISFEIPDLFILPKLESRQNFGYVFGVTFIDDALMTLNAEARFGDEKALAVNAQLRF